MYFLYQIFGIINLKGIVFQLIFVVYFCNYLFHFIADDVHTVYVETDESPRVILCHLSKASKLYQCKLDHIFTKGTNLKFVTTATANIHMTGNYLNKIFLILFYLYIYYRL